MIPGRVWSTIISYQDISYVPGISRQKSIRTYVVVRMIPTFRPWTHTSDDSYIYQLSLVCVRVVGNDVFLWQHEIYLWHLPGTASLYSETPVDLACLRNHLLHAACRYWYCGCHPQDTAVGRDRTHHSFSSIRAVVYCFSMRSKLAGLRRIMLVFIL